MFSLLVVNDEVNVADGLYHMLHETFADRLEVRRCYSCEDAKALLTRNRIDILITDIEMQGTSGLELHRLVHEQWPMIRVIYLTDYADFNYARQALELQALAYVLKSEGDQMLIKAVEKAILSFEEKNAQLMSQAIHVSEHATRLRHLVFHAMHGGTVPDDALRRAIMDSALAFDPEKPLRIGYCMLDDAVSPALVHQAMHLIEQLMLPHMPLLLTDMNARCFSMIYQPASDNDQNLLTGHLEIAQRLIEAQGHRLTICLLDRTATWDELGARVAQLLELINQTSPTPGELLMLQSPDESPTVSPVDPSVLSDGLDSLRRMTEYLLTGQQDLFAGETPRFWQLLQSTTDKEKSTALYSALRQFMQDCSTSFLGCDADPTMLDRFDVKPGTPLNDLQHRVEKLAQAVFSARSEKQRHRQKRIVRQIDQYISDHLSGDLSLTAIADALHFHPTYISRVYKENSSVSLSDSIAQQRLSMACALLRDTDQSIASIANATGFNTANYFARWFRKWMGCTAQEFREKAMK